MTRSAKNQTSTAKRTTKRKKNPPLLNGLKLPSGEIRYGLTNDYMFRAVLQENNNVLRHLLAALLEIDVSEIISCEITNPIVLGERIDDKTCVMDVRVLLNGQRLINLEMQMGHLENWPNRAIFYLARLYCNIHSGENYSKIKPSIHIGILTEPLFDNVKDLYSEYLLMNTKNKQVFSRNFSLRVLQLSQLETASRKEKKTELYKWAKLFRARTWEELQMVAKNSKVMQEATKCLYELSEEENIRLMCEGRERYQMDVDCARDEGRQAGIAEGLAKGHAAGLTEGRAAGIDEERKKGIRNMVSTLEELNVPPQTISEKLQKKYFLSPEEARAYLND